MRAPITSTKHIVNFSIANTASGAVLTRTIADAFVVSAVNTATEVREGCLIKAVYLEMWLRGSDAGVGSTFIWILEKNEANAPAPAAGNMAALFGYSNKKNILYTTQGLINDDTGVATPIVRQWFKIPKGKQRFGLQDKLQIHLFAQSGSIDDCGLAVFKEYY